MFKRKIKREQVWRYRVLPVFGALAIAAGVIVVRFVLLMNMPFTDMTLVYTNEGGGKAHAIHLNDGRDEILDREAPNPIALQTNFYAPTGPWLASWNDVELQLIHMETGETRLVGSYNTFDRRIAWSPDGQSFVFTADLNSNQATELMRYQLETGTVEQLTDNHFADLAPTFSPDGTQIAYTSAADGIYRLYIMDITTRESHVVTAETFGWDPMWSPDGKWIAFVSNHLDLSEKEGAGDIFIIAPDGTQLQRLTWNPRWDRIVGWER